LETNVTDATESKPQPLVLYTSLQQYQPARELMEAAAVLLTKAEKFKVIPSDADAELASEFRARLNQAIKDLDAARLKSTERHRQLVEAMNAEAATKLNPMRAVLAQVDELLMAHLKRKQEEHEAAQKRQRDEEARVERERQEAERKAREANAAAQKAAADAEAARLAAANAASEEERKEAERLAAEADKAHQAAVETTAQEASRMVQLETRQEQLYNMPTVAAPSKSVRGTYGSSTGLRDNWKWRLVNTEAQPASESVKLVPDEFLVAPEDRLDSKVLNALAKSRKDKARVPGIEFYNDALLNSRAGR
jgi:hypothetical protein